MGIGELGELIGANRKRVQVLKLTTTSVDRNVIRVFQLLYKMSQTKNIVFDLLGIFQA